MSDNTEPERFSFRAFYGITSKGVLTGAVSIGLIAWLQH